MPSVLALYDEGRDSEASSTYGMLSADMLSSKNSADATSSAYTGVERITSIDQRN